MAEAVYALCALTSLASAILLVRGYLRRRTRLLLWSSACFVGLALNNALLFLDLAVIPAVDLAIPRALVALVSMAVLVYGFVWDSR